MGSSPAFEDFLDSFNVMSPRWRDDFDFDALGHLSAKEREEAEDLLIGRQRELDDPRAPRALAFMKSERAVAELEAIAARGEGTGEFLVEVARALLTLTGKQDGAALISGVLRDGDRYGRIRAANSLRYFDKLAAEPALLAALDDPEWLVRANAVESLYSLYGLTPYSDPTKRLGQVTRLIEFSWPSLHAEGKRELRAILDATDAGQSPEELGLDAPRPLKSAAYKQFLKSLRTDPGRPPWADSLDLDALDKIGDEERPRLEIALFSALEKGDHRAAAALARLGSERAKAVLDDVLEEE